MKRDFVIILICSKPRSNYVVSLLRQPIEVLKAKFYSANFNGTSSISSWPTPLSRRQGSKLKICVSSINLPRQNFSIEMMSTKFSLSQLRILIAPRTQFVVKYAFWSIFIFDVTRRGGRNRKTNCWASNMEKRNATRKETRWFTGVAEYRSTMCISVKFLHVRIHGRECDWNLRLLRVWWSEVFAQLQCLCRLLWRVFEWLRKCWPANTKRLISSVVR